MKIGIVLYPTFGGSGIVATELGKALSRKGHEIHFITYSQPVKLGILRGNIFYHEVSTSDYPLFEYTPYEQVLTSKLVDVVKFEKLDLLHVHYAIPHASAAYMAQQILKSQGIHIPFMAKWPNKITPGTKFNFPIHHTDIFSTIAAAGNATAIVHYRCSRECYPS